MKATYYFFMTLLCCSCSLYDLKIINNPSYSIGVVVGYTPPSSASITFTYDVEGKIMSKYYNNGLYHWNVPSSGVSIGNKYMVQYDSLAPSTARMLFSYPVADSADYKKYVTLFKTNPPGYPSP